MSARLDSIRLVAGYDSVTGYAQIVGHVEADTAADAPLPSAFSGYYLMSGSTMHVIADNTMYMINSAGTWIIQPEPTLSAYYTKAETDAAIAAAVNALDVASAGGDGRYIKSISQADGLIVPIVGTLTETIASGNTSPPTSRAVYNAISSKADISQAFGRGSRIPYNSDCNAIDGQGYYYAESATHAGGLTNAPFTTSGFLILQTAWYQAISDTVGRQQTAESIQSNTYYQRKRFYLYGSGTWSWTAWKTVISNSIV